MTSYFSTAHFPTVTSLKLHFTSYDNLLKFFGGLSTTIRLMLINYNKNYTYGMSLFDGIKHLDFSVDDDDECEVWEIKEGINAYLKQLEILDVIVTKARNHGYNEDKRKHEDSLSKSNK